LTLKNTEFIIWKMLTKNDLKEIGHLVNDLLNLRFEQFAVMIQNEFKYIHTILDTKTDKSDLDDFKTETRNNFTEIRTDISGMKSDISEIRSDLNDTRLDVADIKYDLRKLTDDGGCIYKLENDMKIIKTKLNFN